METKGMNKVDRKSGQDVENQETRAKRGRQNAYLGSLRWGRGGPKFY